MFECEGGGGGCAREQSKLDRDVFDSLLSSLSHLAQVELRLPLGLDALDLDERRVDVLRALAPVGGLGRKRELREI